MESKDALSRIAHEALEWHALQRQGGLDAVAQAKFMDWLVSSPAHLREYLAVGRLAAELSDALRTQPVDEDATIAASCARTGNVVALPVRSMRDARGAVVPGRARRARLPRFAAAAAVIAMVAIGAALPFAWPQSTHYTTAHGETRRIELPDGTVAHLNAESALGVRFNLLQRRVELERGQASFVVAEDPRPLSVHAAGLQVRDIGTTFDVALQREQARIGVVEGRVLVTSDDGRGRALADLRAGHSARVAYRDQAVSVTSEDADVMTAWWGGRIVFRNETLRDVADQFNRFNGMRLDVDEDAGALRLTGNLRADDLQSMRAFLDEQPSLTTHSTPGGVRVSARLAGNDLPARR